MAKQRRLGGNGQGTPLTVWISEKTKTAIDREANKTNAKRSTVARKVLESRFGA